MDSEMMPACEASASILLSKLSDIAEEENSEQLNPLKNNIRTLSMMSLKLKALYFNHQCEIEELNNKIRNREDHIELLEVAFCELMMCYRKAISMLKKIDYL